MNDKILLRHESKDSKDSKSSNTSCLTDINEYAEINLTPQNIDMFKRFLTNENLNIFLDNHNSLQEKEIMPEYTDIEKQITKKIVDVRKLFNIKNTIFKSMQSDNSYMLSLFRKGFKKLFFGPKGIVTKKSPELKKYYKSFEIKGDLKSKIFAGSLDYYDYLAKHVNAFNERLNFNRKRILVLGGNFTITNTNLEKIHQKYLEKEKKRRLRKLLIKKKNNKSNNLKIIKEKPKSEKKARFNQNEESIRIDNLRKNNLFLNYTNNSIRRKSMFENEGQKNKKFNLNNENNFNKGSFQYYGKSSKEIISFGNYLFKKNTNNSNNNSDNQTHFSFLKTEANNNEKLDLPGMNNNTQTFIYKRNKKLSSNFLFHQYNLPKYRKSELSFKGKNYNLLKTSKKINVESSNDLQKIEPNKLMNNEITENNNNKTNCNTVNSKIRLISSPNENIKFCATATQFKLNKRNKNNFSLKKIKLALKRKINNTTPLKKYGKSLNRLIKKSSKKMKITCESVEKKNSLENKRNFISDIKNDGANEKNIKKKIMTNINYSKKKNKNTNTPLKLYYDYESNLENSKPIKRFLKNIVKNKDKEKEENFDVIREKFHKNIKKMHFLTHTLAIAKKKCNLK